ncbi:phosphate acyltransferase PlsX [Rickettsiales bacterium]|nr:phosphate acyltransferase PlsX [Rickettsiales bacterium]
MTKNKIISLDAMGGDHAPDSVINGADIIASSRSDIEFLIYGDEVKITPILDKCKSLKKKSKLIHTDSYISADEKPSVALRKGGKSSMRLAINSVKSEESDAIVSAGNTGALMAISKVILRALPDIDRPAIVTSIPNIKGKNTIMLDMGANVDCSSEILYQFAVMGYVFAKAAYKVKNPKIGILNVGSEDLKGSDMVRSAATLLKESDISEHFHGYVEGDDITRGIVDVVVTDGFTGNISLKSIEGAAKLISNTLKKGFKSSILAQIGYLLASRSLKKVLKDIDPNTYNGAMLIGLNGIVVKSHGSADARSFANAINVAISLIEDKINERIVQEIESSSYLQKDYIDDISGAL